jgi:hypothetical protein
MTTEIVTKIEPVPEVRPTVRQTDEACDRGVVSSAPSYSPRNASG